MPPPSFPLELLLPYPKLRGTAFLALAVLFGTLLTHDWLQGQGIPDKPEQLTITQAAERARSTDWVWVEVQDSEHLYWDCSTLTYWETTVFDVTGKGMEIFVTDPAESTVMIVSFNYRLTCDQLLARQPALRGRLEHLTDDHCACNDYKDRLVQYDQSATFLILHTAYEPPGQGPDTLLIGLTVFSLLASLQGFYVGFILKREPKPPTRTDHDFLIPPSDRR